MKVFKYPIELTKEQEVMLHGEDAKIVHFGLDRSGQLCVWAEVWPWGLVPHKILIVETGREFNPFERKHVSTFMAPDGYVWHLYVSNHGDAE